MHGGMPVPADVASEFPRQMLGVPGAPPLPGAVPAGPPAGAPPPHPAGVVCSAPFTVERRAKGDASAVAVTAAEEPATKAPSDLQDPLAQLALETQPPVMPWRPPMPQMLPPSMPPILKVRPVGRLYAYMHAHAHARSHACACACGCACACACACAMRVHVHTHSSAQRRSNVACCMFA